jgi:hypothetical protein
VLWHAARRRRARVGPAAARAARQEERRVRALLARRARRAPLPRPAPPRGRRRAVPVRRLSHRRARLGQGGVPTTWCACTRARRGSWR